MNLQLKAKCPDIKPISSVGYASFVSNLGLKLAKSFGISPYELRLSDPIPGQTFYDEVVFYALSKNVEARSNWKSQVVTALGSKGFEYDSVRKSLTLEHMNHQITVNLVDEAVELENSALYYSYGGIGRLYSLFAKHMGFVFDLKGLRIPITYNGQLVSEVDYASYFNDSLNIIGFLPSRYDRKFYNVESMINELVNSRYFSKQVFEGELDPEFVASPIYALLAPKLADPAVKNNHDYTSGKSPWLTLVKKSNPQIINSIKNTIRTHERKFQIESKLSSEFITNVVGSMSEANMVKFKDKFKASFKPEEDFDHYILSSSIENLQERISKVFTQTSEDDKVDTGISETLIPRGSKAGDTFASGKFDLTVISIRPSDNYGNVRITKAPASCSELIGSTRTISVDVSGAPNAPKDIPPMPRYNPY